MINLVVLVCAAIAGGIIYFAAHKDLEEILQISIQKNIFFAVMVVLVLIMGVYITQYMHLSEVAAQNSNQIQRVGVWGCIIESPSDCQGVVNAINNSEYTKLQAGQIQVGQFYIPFSLSDAMVRNALTYFLGGVLIVWSVLFFGGKNERTV